VLAPVMTHVLPCIEVVTGVQDSVEP